MSIRETSDDIKFSARNFWILVAITCSIILVTAWTSFQLGKGTPQTPSSFVGTQQGTPAIIASPLMTKTTQSYAEFLEKPRGEFFASKNGTRYYPIQGCKAGDRVLSENRVYFQTEEQAQKAGYSRSAQC